MNLKHIDGKVIVAVDLEGKNWHTFSNGVKIRRERQFDEFNRRISEPVNAIVVSAENIPDGSEILIHPNAPTESNQIHNYKKLSGKETSSDVKYYSIPSEMCFIWRDGDEWRPLPPYETALRIFVPYKGFIEGIEPTQIADALYCTSGDLKGKAVKTLKACDYEVIFQDISGKEGRIIRWRPNGDEKHKREPEAIARREDVTKKIKKGEYLVGLSTSDCKPINELINV
jgi:hypothetical protein